METLTKLKVMKVETEVRSIIAELDVALFFLGEANESSDKQHQGRIIYAHLAHQAVIRLLPGLALSDLDEARIRTRLLQVHTGLKLQGICAARTLEEMVMNQRKRFARDSYLN
jgi:hypothetical protein